MLVAQILVGGNEDIERTFESASNAPLTVPARPSACTVLTVWPGKMRLSDLGWFSSRMILIRAARQP